MPFDRIGIGKGLAEPCSPYRSCQVFGEPLGSPNPFGWNCNAIITGATDKFDLSGFTDYAEVVVALIAGSSLSPGIYSFLFSWHKLDTGKLLCEISFQITLPEGYGLYGCSWIGYTPQEIWETGLYVVDITVDGPEPYYTNIVFEVTALPAGPPEEPPPEEIPPYEPPPEEPLPETFWNPIVDVALSIGNWFTTTSTTVSGWVSPFNWLATPFSWIGNQFLWLAYWFSLARNWSIAAWSRILTFLNPQQIIALLQDWLNWAYNSMIWLTNWVNNVWGVIDQWWDSTKITVQGWIGGVVTQLNDYINSVYYWARGAVEWWESWKPNIPTLDQAILWFKSWTANVNSLIYTWWMANLGQVQSMINNTFTANSSLWAGWTDVAGQVVNFFSDPLEYLWARFTDWFLGKE